MEATMPINLKNIMRLALIVVLPLTLGGCMLGIAAGAGYVAGDEIQENDGFDPLEDVRGVDKDKKKTEEEKQE